MGDLPHEAIAPYREPQGSEELGLKGDDEMPTLEDALKERAARALDEVLAEKLPEMEAAIHAAAARAIERAMNEAAGTSSGIEAAPSTSSPASAPAAPRPRAAAPAATTPPSGAAGPRPAPRARTRHQPAAAPSSPAPAPTNVVRVPTQRVKTAVVEKGHERRSPGQLDETKAKLLAQIKETPGQNSEALVASLAAKGFHVSTVNLRLPLRALAQEALIHHQGGKRYTRYFPGPDPEAKRKPAKKAKAGKK